MNKAEEFQTRCGWCDREVVSFVAPPAMVEVKANPSPGLTPSFWRICLDCFVELHKLIASRAPQVVP